MQKILILLSVLVVACGPLSNGVKQPILIYPNFYSFCDYSIKPACNIWLPEGQYNSDSLDKVGLWYSIFKNPTHYYSDSNIILFRNTKNRYLIIFKKDRVYPKNFRTNQTEKEITEKLLAIPNKPIILDDIKFSKWGGNG